MKKIFYILLPILMISCSENKDKVFIDYAGHFDYLTYQINSKLDEAHKQVLENTNDLLRGNPNKTGPWIRIVEEVRSESNSLFDMIETSKKEILDFHNLSKTNFKDLKGSKSKLSLIHLDQIIEELKEFTVKIEVILKDVRYQEYIKKYIENTPAADRLAQLPIFNSSYANSSELYAILCMIQYRVKLTESLIVNHLYQQFETSSGYWFVNLNAIVIPKAKEIYSGDTFEAEIFLAAWDTTSSPTVIIGDQILKVYDGKAHYKKLITSKDTGFITEQGKIFRRRPGSRDGDSISFTIEYKIIK